MKTINILLLSAFTSITLTGCVAPLVVGGSAAVGTLATREKGVGGTFSDSQISVQIKAKFYSYHPDLHAAVGVNVQNGEVLLTGSVKDRQWQIDAERMSWEVKGVKQVLNNIEVSGGGTLSSVAKDAWITTQIKSSLLFKEEIRSLNYSIKTVGGVVYLMGIAQNQNELSNVIETIRGVEGVKRVMNYVKLAEEN